ncbi:hypothetical protein BGW38_007058 [Lunasporangiospora selenospora]|uniref:GDP-fucose protein O-fucosyltransferase 2 n=1 Tax=Lunasporangiospora selenospora TaxID=979761 RepID=A0A9P6G4U5_9FUNG|nr:hypothetical protein BGW38_007058 [Lunasporangiospora selenospora]
MASLALSRPFVALCFVNILLLLSPARAFERHDLPAPLRKDDSTFHHRRALGEAAAVFDREYVARQGDETYYWLGEQEPVILESLSTAPGQDTSLLSDTKILLGPENGGRILIDNSGKHDVSQNRYLLVDLMMDNGIGEVHAMLEYSLFAAHLTKRTLVLPPFLYFRKCVNQVLCQRTSAKISYEPHLTGNPVQRWPVPIEKIYNIEQMRQMANVVEFEPWLKGMIQAENEHVEKKKNEDPDPTEDNGQDHEPKKHNPKASAPKKATARASRRSRRELDLLEKKQKQTEQDQTGRSTPRSDETEDISVWEWLRQRKDYEYNPGRLQLLLQQFDHLDNSTLFSENIHEFLYKKPISKEIIVDSWPQEGSLLSKRADPQPAEPLDDIKDAQQIHPPDDNKNKTLQKTTTILYGYPETPSRNYNRTVQWKIDQNEMKLIGFREYFSTKAPLESVKVLHLSNGIIKFAHNMMVFSNIEGRNRFERVVLDGLKYSDTILDAADHLLRNFLKDYTNGREYLAVHYRRQQDFLMSHFPSDSFENRRLESPPDERDDGTKQLLDHLHTDGDYDEDESFNAHANPEPISEDPLATKEKMDRQYLMGLGTVDPRSTLLRIGRELAKGGVGSPFQLRSLNNWAIRLCNETVLHRQDISDEHKERQENAANGREPMTETCKRINSQSLEIIALQKWEAAIRGQGHHLPFEDSIQERYFYMATDEREFATVKFMQSQGAVVVGDLVDDYFGRRYLDMMGFEDWYGYLDQLICVKAKTFLGSPTSVFSGTIINQRVGDMPERRGVQGKGGRRGAGNGWLYRPVPFNSEIMRGDGDVQTVF